MYVPNSQFPNFCLQKNLYVGNTDNPAMAKIIRLNTREAVHRLDQMQHQIEVQMRMVIRIEQALEVANQIVSTEFSDDKALAGAECYSMIHFSLSIRLALEVAKLFEQPTPRIKEGLASRYNRSDIASIPLMVRLLRQRRCRSALSERARNWQPEFPRRGDRYERECHQAIDDALSAFARCQRGGDRSVNLKMIKDFRDGYLAHLYVENEIDNVPTYDDIFKLVDVARDVTMHARLALTGVNHDLHGYENLMAKDARRFWLPALTAAREATRR